ncbi:hypothetical protein H9Q16_19095 [Sulfitobacter sp. TSTF-M16]|uniref:Uncharacterized protein n=1 Tax=Sulfitobacter aestuariivivens TaxID=2766981 RepID=A0A927D6S6_9RHOB|nr:hypothetical protein [Sulfitobacter aestuariivivens]MBD3666050.1 hypothetical protein [Sulfitobacter aestuariivivens]
MCDPVTGQRAIGRCRLAGPHPLFERAADIHSEHPDCFPISATIQKMCLNPAFFLPQCGESCDELPRMSLYAAFGFRVMPRAMFK